MMIEFAPYTIDVRKRELLRDGEPVAIEGKVFDVLCHLIEHRDQVVTRDDLMAAVWDGRIVSDAAVSTAISAARRAIGDTGVTQTFIKTVHGRGFRFAAETVDAPKPERAMVQDIRYCTTGDGTRIAHASVGEGPVLLRTGNWMTHLEFELESPLWRHWVAGLSRGRRFVRYDQRGNGLSERKPSDVSFTAMVDDLEHVVAAADLDRFTLMGMSQGCAVAAEYAARNPDRLDALILYGGFPRGWERTNYPHKDHYRALSTLMRTGWGQDDPTFRQIFTSGFMPDATEDHHRWFNELQRRTVLPHIAAALYDAFGQFDVTASLGKIATPTLVAHARDDRIIPVAASQSMAAQIPGARLATFASNNHILMADEPAFANFMDEIDRFLGEVR